jgi:DMSO reductase family type II enzyme heme b subunit
MVKARRVTADDAALLDPASAEWRDAEPDNITLEPTPITAQPSKYIQVKWETQPYGLVTQVEVRAVHTGERLYFRLSWPDETENDGIRDTDQFGDAAAVLFPVNGDAPLQSMGSPSEPVNAWYWRPDMEAALSVVAQGTGTTRRTQDPELQAQGRHGGGEWSVVIRRKLESTGAEYISLSPGVAGKVGFAVWQGANQERGGLKAVTLDWQPLEIEA